MTEQSNAELIAEARAQASQPMIGKSQWRELDKAILMIRRLADALEAAEKGWDVDVERLAEAHNARIAAEQRAAEYAAVVENVRAWKEEPGDADEIAFEDLNSILATAPADALRELKADVWDEGEKAGMKNQANWDGWRDTKPPITNPYREERA